MDEFEVVPWFSAKEWMTVYDLIFSKDVEKLEDGYERLRCWKARCDKLSAGIECTLIILEAVLVETRVKDVPNKVSIIKSVYSLAITRFLNHAASFDKEKICASLYKIAGSLNIPEWIVNLRHEAAHGQELPSVEVLRAGVDFALRWLHSAYWTKGIPQESTSLTKKFKTHELKTKLLFLVEIYQKVYMQEMEGVYVIEEIECPNLRKAMEELLTNNDYGPRRDCSDKNSLVNEDMPLTTTQYSLILTEKIYYVFKVAQKKSVINNIMDYFLEVSYFVPKEEVVKILELSQGKTSDVFTIIRLKEMWNNVLCDAIQKCGALPILLRKLVNFSNLDTVRQKWAAYWVKLISQGIKKAILIRKEFMRRKGNTEDFDQLLLADDPITRAEQREIEKKLKNCYSGFLDIITLSPNYLPDIKDLIEDVIYHPRSNSTIYFEELLDIYVKPLSSRQKKKLVEALNIYLMTNVSDDSLEPDKIYDLEDVYALIERTKPVAKDSPILVQCPYTGSILEISSLSSSLSPSIISPLQQSPSPISDISFLQQSPPSPISGISLPQQSPPSSISGISPPQQSPPSSISGCSSGSNLEISSSSSSLSPSIILPLQQSPSPISGMSPLQRSPPSPISGISPPQQSPAYSISCISPPQQSPASSISGISPLQWSPPSFISGSEGKWDKRSTIETSYSSSDLSILLISSPQQPPRSSNSGSKRKWDERSTIEISSSSSSHSPSIISPRQQSLSPISDISPPQQSPPSSISGISPAQQSTPSSISGISPPQQSPPSSISGCLSDDDSWDWEETPVGMLPWQEKVDMVMEEEEVAYTSISED